MGEGGCGRRDAGALGADGAEEFGPCACGDGDGVNGLTRVWADVRARSPHAPTYDAVRGMSSKLVGRPILAEGRPPVGGAPGPQLVANPVATCPRPHSVVWVLVDQHPLPDADRGQAASVWPPLVLRR